MLLAVERAAIGDHLRKSRVVVDRRNEPAATALPAEPALQVLKAPFSHRSIHLEWQVGTGAAFAAGSPLYALRHAGEEAVPLFAETLVFGLSLGAVRGNRFDAVWIARRLGITRT